MGVSANTEKVIENTKQIVWLYKTKTIKTGKQFKICKEIIALGPSLSEGVLPKPAGSSKVTTDVRVWQLSTVEDEGEDVCTVRFLWC